MDELKDVSIHHTALRILSEITAMKDYDTTIHKTVQVFSSEWMQNSFIIFLTFFELTRLEIGLFTRSR